jgi:hypothetical protein
MVMAVGNVVYHLPYRPSTRTVWRFQFEVIQRPDKVLYGYGQRFQLGNPI